MLKEVTSRAELRECSLRTPPVEQTLQRSTIEPNDQIVKSDPWRVCVPGSLAPGAI